MQRQVRKRVLQLDQDPMFIAPSFAIQHGIGPIRTPREPLVIKVYVLPARVVDADRRREGGCARNTLIDIDQRQGWAHA